MLNLSVIVPVFNTEEQIERCLQSLSKLENTEIMVINDGSTDKSEQVIKKYIEKNNNIVYYSKPNTGIADTRNFGIEHANGEYILFVDSDDYIETDLIQRLLPYMKDKIDIIKFKLKRVTEEGNILEKVNGSVFEKQTGEEAFAKLYSTDNLLDSPCTYLFRREYLIENNFKFTVGTYHEDFGLIPLIIVNAKTVVSVNFYGYNYVQSSNSITRNNSYEKTLKKMNDALIHYDNMIEQIENYKIGEYSKDNLKIFYTNSIILKLKELKDEDVDKFILEIKKRHMIQNIKVRNLKQLLKRILLSINIKWYLKR